MQPRVRLIPAHEYRRDRWRNGRGWTREIHAQGADPWDWRLSIAEVEAPAAFSRFPGVDRELVLLEGEGLELVFADGGRQALQPPHQRLRFDGERAVEGNPQGGRATCFNLMWRRDVVETQLWHRPMVGTMVVFTDPGSTWVLHLLTGRVVFNGDAAGLPPLAAGDTALLGAGQARTRHAFDGSGEALLVRIDPRRAAQ